MSGPQHPIARPRLKPEQVAQMLQALPSEHVQALTLRIFGGLSVTEVALVMGKNDAEVKILIHQAVHDLRAQIALVSEGSHESR
jgi:DNA-directed RNA polymerase specialized sigma24 family protein